MVRKIRHRLAVLTTTLLAMVGTTLTTGTAVQAAPARPTSITVAGAGLPEPVTVRVQTNPTLFTALLEQVNWLNGRGQTQAPKKADLGPRYTIVVLVNDVPKQSYHLYPQATGGPRAFRPARQPDGRKPGAAWFYGRLNMPEALRAVGAPLPKQHDPISGGIGGGERVISDDALNPGRHVSRLLDQLPVLILLTGAVLFFITVGLAGIALLVRRRTS